VITLDASSVPALLSEQARAHRRAVEVLRSTPVPTVVPAASLAEIDRVLTSGLGQGAMLRFLRGLECGETLLDCGDADLPRIRELMLRFEDLDLAGAAVVVCAERNGGNILTFARKRLEAVEADVPIKLIP
jgi:predicted nucleic acid-binding protein